MLKCLCRSTWFEYIACIKNNSVQVQGCIAMKETKMKNFKKLGGAAALGHTTALLVGLVLSFTWMFPLLNAAPDQAQRFLTGHQALVILWYVIVDWGSAITLVILLLALYERLKAGSPKFMRVAVVLGFFWAGLTIGTGDLMLHNFGVVANLHGSIPAQAAAWTALARGIWVLLLSLAAVRTRGLPRTIGYLGVFLGITGCLTMVPAFAEILFMVFGPGMMVWSAWVGIVMLRDTAMMVQPVHAFLPHHST